MNDLMTQFTVIFLGIQKNILVVLEMILGLWLLHFCNWLLRYRLNVFGIIPRTGFGLIGIFTSPFLHADFNHLFFNSIPLFVLANFVLLNGWPNFYCASITIVVLSGAAVWLFGRRGIHIGASGLVMGYWGYLLVNAFQQSTAMAVTLGIVCLYYFGGLVLNLFPTQIKTSWEGHVFGLAAGIFAAYFCKIAG